MGMQELIERMRKYATCIGERNSNEGYADLSESELYDFVDEIQMRIHGWVKELKALSDEDLLAQRKD